MIQFLRTIAFSLCLLLSSLLGMQAQHVGIKTNLIPDIAFSPNLGLEVGLSRHCTLDISGELNIWPINGHKWKHWMVQPEIRIWWCERFQGSFWGIHAIGGQYNFGNIPIDFKFLGSDFSNLKEKRYQGWAAGAGVGYGYSWIFGKHWNMEFEIGVGWMYTRYDAFPCTDCGTKLEEDRPHNYFGPTKLALSLEYLF